MKKNYNERYLYLDNKGNGHLLKHKLKKYKLEKLDWIYIKKVYKLKLQVCYAKDIPKIEVQRPVFDIPRKTEMILINN